jgi:hypothetical protein
MAMSYTSLVAPKGTTGSLANWVNYSKLDTATVLDEAQSLLFQLLRVREMRTEWTFGIAQGYNCSVPLPLRFLDPIGDILDNQGARYRQNIPSVIAAARSYQVGPEAALDPDPFTTGLAGSGVLAINSVTDAADIPEGSTVTIEGASTVDGVNPNGTFRVTQSYPTVDRIYIEVPDGSATVGTVAGGGSSATLTSQALIEGSPSRWAIVDERLQFDCALEDITLAFRLLYYRAPKLLSATNETNWLTVRYPKLLRVACMTAAADYMKDSAEYQKHLSALTALVGSTAAENDLQYRGADMGTDTPTPGDYY